MTDLPTPDAPRRDPSAYIGTSTLRTGERTVTTTLEVRDNLRNARGDLRIGAVAFAVDEATGVSMGLAVVERDLWVVTTDLDVRSTTPVVDGPLRIDVEVLRAGATTAVSSYTLHDESTERVVGGGTATARPFPFEFESSFLSMPVGQTLAHGVDYPKVREQLVTELGFLVGEDGSVEVEVGEWLKNPWGIVHGGVTACLIDVAADVAGATVLGRPAQSIGELVRYLAPGRVGPLRARPRVLASDGGRVLVEVRVTDAGADGRLTAVGTVELV